MTANVPAGAWGIPLLMVAGDNKACAEAVKLVPGIRQAVIKQAISRFSAMHLHPKAACRLIKQEAKAAIKLIDKIKPYELTKPITVEVRLSTTDIAQSTLKSYSSGLCDASLSEDDRIILYGHGHVQVCAVTCHLHRRRKVFGATPVGLAFERKMLNGMALPTCPVGQVSIDTDGLLCELDRAQ